MLYALCPSINLVQGNKVEMGKNDDFGIKTRGMDHMILYIHIQRT